MSTWELSYFLLWVSQDGSMLLYGCYMLLYVCYIFAIYVIKIIELLIKLIVCYYIVLYV